MNKVLKELSEMNVLDKTQSELIYRMTDFSRYIASRKYNNDKVRKKAKDILFKLEEVAGIYEELTK